MLKILKHLQPYLSLNDLFYLQVTMGGNNLSTPEKQEIQRFHKDIKKVTNVVKEAKAAQKMQEYKVANDKFMLALGILQKLINETNLPQKIRFETMHLVWDIIDESRHVKEYQKILDIAQQSRIDKAEQSDANVHSNVDSEVDSEDEFMQSFNDLEKDYLGFEEAKKNLNVIPNRQLGNAIAKQEQLRKEEEEEDESGTESESGSDDDHDDEKFAHVKQAIMEEENAGKVEKPTNFNEALKIAKECRSTYNFACDDVQLKLMVARIIWEKEMEKKVQENEIKCLENQQNEKFQAQSHKSETCHSDTLPGQTEESQAEKDAREIRNMIYRLVHKPSQFNEGGPTFDDVIGLNSVKQLLTNGIQEPIDRPYLVEKGIIIPLSGMLLFGPPGTGKSLLAQALANQAKGCSFMQISKANITSKWLGESEKLVTTLFSVAKEVAPCIIFVDEVEGMLQDRSKASSSSLVHELLAEMQHLGEHGVFVLAATNNPWEIDVAFLRRFNATFYIPLPTLQDRILIMKKLLENTRGATDVEHHQLTEYDFEKLALFTENYSGGHLRNLVEAALFFRLIRTQNATHFRRSVGRKGFMQPCAEEEPGAKKMPYKNVKNVHYPPVVMADMEKALYTSKPQINKDHIRKLKDWGKKNSQMPNDM